jgi:outer membrane protein assembly factor BamB
VSSVALNPVTVGGGKVLVSTNAYFGTQQLHVLDASSGAKLWSHDFGAIHSVDPPAYADGSVYVATGGHGDSFIWAFDAATGVERFHTAYGNQWSRWYAPVVVGQTLYMAGGSVGGMYAFSTVDGTQLWFLGLNQYDEFTPAVRDTLVYAYTGSYSPEVTVANASTGAIAYQIPDSAFGWNGWSMGLAPVLGSSNNLLAAQTGSGRLLSFDLASRRIGWAITGAFAGQVTLADGVIYVRSNQGFQARRESDGSLLWSWTPPEGSLEGTMIATRNLLFVSNGTTTYALDLGARLQAWSYPAGGHLSLSKDGLLIIAQSNGRVAAIAVK